ncbi:hypothetical protein L7F22_049116 [Adiantum nelumboides]|nr:hypothetical protein [Adiantum nelumboides]
MAMLLPSAPGNQNALKAGLIAAEYAGVKVELTKDFEYATVTEQWINVATMEVGWVYPLLGFGPYLYSEELLESALAALKLALRVLNNHLASNAYLVGHSNNSRHIPIVQLSHWANGFDEYDTCYDYAYCPYSWSVLGTCTLSEVTKMFVF